MLFRHFQTPLNFNPRSSCEERPVENGLESFTIAFQSTLLMRGATRSISLKVGIHDFNPRSSCEERLNWMLIR